MSFGTFDKAAITQAKQDKASLAEVANAQPLLYAHFDEQLDALVASAEQFNTAEGATLENAQAHQALWDKASDTLFTLQVVANRTSDYKASNLLQSIMMHIEDLGVDKIAPQPA